MDYDKLFKKHQELLERVEYLEGIIKQWEPFIEKLLSNKALIRHSTPETWFKKDGKIKSTLDDKDK